MTVRMTTHEPTGRTTRRTTGRTTGMTTALLARRWLDDYARNPVNVLLLVVVPVVFVGVVAGSLADAAKLLDGTGGLAVVTATAGWTTAFLVGIAMYFQTSTTRETDRRLVTAGLPPGRVVTSRLLTGLTIALMVSAAALVTLAIRSGIGHPLRVVVGTLMFAVIYLAIGALVGAVTGNPVNGVVVLLFVWILDVFFGPAMGAADRPLTRGLPTHFVTLWMVDLPSGHGGAPGDLGWAVAWTVLAVACAWVLTARRISGAHAHRPHHARPHVRGAVRRVRSAGDGQLPAALRAAWRDGRRNPAEWVLLVLVPVVFILTAAAVTPDRPITVMLRENGRQVARTASMRDLHGATMAPIAIASLAAVLGLFVLLDERAGDARVVQAGLRWPILFTARLAVLAAVTSLAAGVSLVATDLVFDATRWPVYVAANLLIGFTYALLGALLVPVVGRVGGVFLAFLLPFLDIGIVQSPMLHPTPIGLARFLPGYGGSRMLLDGALSSGFDESGPLLVGLAWVVCLFTAVALLYRRSVAPQPPRPPRGRVSSGS
jgi:hypothetical protein